MSIFVDETTKVVIQGISPTSQGLYHGLRNKAYGTKVVGGTNPKRGGEEIEGIPVFASVAEAVKETGATASFISVPPRGAADAIIEAAEAGIAFIVCITEGIPAQDEAVAYNRLVAGVPGHPPARARTARASSAPGSATSASPRATSRWREDRSASSRARAR